MAEVTGNFILKGKVILAMGVSYKLIHLGRNLGTEVRAKVIDNQGESYTTAQGRGPKHFSENILSTKQPNFVRQGADRPSR